jgi:hypothetical protein
MSRRPTLDEIRRELQLELELDDHWRTPTDLQHALGLPGPYWYRVALLLERLAADGDAELQVRGRARRFRRRP